MNDRWYLLLFVPIVLLLTINCSGLHSTVPLYTQLLIVDQNWSDEMELRELAENPQDDCISIRVRMGGRSFINQNVLNGVMYEKASLDDYSPAEVFAIEHIRDRSKKLISYFNQNYGPGQRTQNTLTTVYTRTSPKVYSDKVLFEKAPGEDLSSFFYFSDCAVPFKTTGMDYRIIEEFQPQGSLLAEYFTEWTIMPFEFEMQTESIPIELNGDNDINLIFVFPVTVEHYWDWLLNLYDKPASEESFSETNMTLKLNLKDLTVIK